MLFASGAIDRLGSIEEGNTTTDSEPEEIISALGFCNWNGHRINLIDTPRFINFVEDLRGTLNVWTGGCNFFYPSMKRQMKDV